MLCESNRVLSCDSQIRFIMTAHKVGQPNIIPLANHHKPGRDSVEPLMHQMNRDQTCELMRSKQWPTRSFRAVYELPEIDVNKFACQRYYAKTPRSSVTHAWEVFSCYKKIRLTMLNFCNEDRRPKKKNLVLPEGRIPTPASC